MLKQSKQILTKTEINPVMLLLNTVEGDILKNGHQY